MGACSHGRMPPSLLIRLNMADLTKEEVVKKVQKGDSLNGIDLSHIDLSGADLNNANLHSAKLYDTVLSSAKLLSANLSFAKLCNAVLSSASLHSANLSYADLSGADLSSANLFDADLSSADLSGADLSGADLECANIEDANLSGANLSGANLIDADLNNTDLSGTNLSDADLRNTNLRSANLCNAYLRDANLSGAKLYDVNLSSADLSGADLETANLRSADLCDADLNRANLRSADLEYANLTKADISGANIFHYKTHGWTIEGIQCTHVYSYHEAANKDERDKSCRRFNIGEFEEIYKSIPTIDICFSDDFNNLDYLRLADIQEKIRIEMPDVGLRLKKLEREGFDMVVTLEVKKENQIEDVLKEINKLYKDKELEQVFKAQIKHLAGQKALQAVSKALGAVTTRDINIEKLEIHMPNKIINTDGKGNIVIVDSQFERSAIGNGATVNIDYSQNYFTDQVTVDDKFDELRKEVSEVQQKLIDALVENLKTKQNSRAQDIWEQLKEGIKTSASAVSILKTLADLLRFSI